MKIDSYFKTSSLTNDIAPTWKYGGLFLFMNPYISSLWLMYFWLVIGGDEVITVVLQMSTFAILYGEI